MSAFLKKNSLKSKSVAIKVFNFFPPNLTHFIVTILGRPHGVFVSVVTFVTTLEVL